MSLRGNKAALQNFKREWGLGNTICHEGWTEEQGWKREKGAKLVLKQNETNVWAPADPCHLTLVQPGYYSSLLMMWMGLPNKVQDTQWYLTFRFAGYILILKKHFLFIWNSNFTRQFLFCFLFLFSFWLNLEALSRKKLNQKYSKLWHASPMDADEEAHDWKKWFK